MQLQCDYSLSLKINYVAAILKEIFFSLESANDEKSAPRGYWWQIKG